MVSTVMLAAMRTILDESSAGFWTDAECYAALADGQNEVIKELSSVYRARYKIDNSTEMSYELASLINDESSTTTTGQVSVPTGFLWLIGAHYDHDGAIALVPCIVVSSDRGFPQNENNTFLQATTAEPHVYLATVSDTLKVNFIPAPSGTASYTFTFIKTPTDIASGQNAVLPVSTHSAIVNYGTSRMLEKDQRSQESQMIYNKYLQELKTLLGL